MADNTAIEWTDATWNPITGCSVVSPGCTNCYAMRLAGGRLKHTASRAGLTTTSKAGPVWNGQVRLNADQLTQPLRWRRPRKIFVCAHGDLFHESVPDSWIDQVFAVMALSPQHTFQVLTKRADRMRAYVSDPATPGRVIDAALRLKELPADWRWPLPNVWLGVSAEDQARADERIPDLLATPAAVRFLSAEPLLGPIRLHRLPGAHDDDEDVRIDALAGHYITGPRCEDPTPCERLDWVIVGGESGPGARPIHPDWARQIRDDCAAAGVPFFFKQWGGWAPGESITGYSPNFGGHYDDDQNRWAFTVYSPAAIEGLHIDEEPDVWSVSKKTAGRTLDGALHDAMPEAAAR